MHFKLSLKLWHLALCVFFASSILADPQITERERRNSLNNQKYIVSGAVTKMTSRISPNMTMGWKMFAFLQEHPRNFDLVFAVGPQKSLVKASSLILSSVSPVFKSELESRWENAVPEPEEEEGIPLPNLDPETFKIFVELTILDSWSEEALKALELPSNQLLHLMSICHKYGLTTALENLTKLANNFLRDFGSHVKPQEFLLLSQAQLETILASDDLVMKEADVYDYAYRWAAEQCRKQGLEKSGANLRTVLGSALHEIRFSLMTIQDFAKIIQQQGLLSPKEVAEIVQLIAVGKNASELHGTAKYQVKVEKRKDPLPPALDGSSRVSVTQVFPVVDTPFVCDGNTKRINFNMDMKISLKGLGFIGPIDADAFYNVTVQVWKHNPYKSNERYLDTMNKRIFAEKSKIFYFVFDQPVILDPLPHDSWNNYYLIYYTLEGPNTRSLQYEFAATKRINDGSKEFVVRWWNSQLVEIVYNTV